MRTADGEDSSGGLSAGGGVSRDVGNGEGDPYGGTGVGGGVGMARAGDAGSSATPRTATTIVRRIRRRIPTAS